MSSDKELPLTGHLAELRRRLISCFIAVALASVLCYGFIDPIFTMLSRPLEAVMPTGTSLIFTSYTEAFFIYIKLAITCGIFVASPFILYEIWAFVAPGLYEHERRWALPFVICSSLLFICGGLFGYMVIFPALFRFFASYTGKDLRLLPSVSEYFGLTVRLLLGFGCAFELPAFMAFLGLIGLVDAHMLRKCQGYAILIAFILAAILTPTSDILNQLLVALPLIALYEFSIFLVWMIGIGQRSEVRGQRSEEKNRGQKKRPWTDDNII
jgi:sec-independent protein translocase protein TatC